MSENRALTDGSKILKVIHYMRPKGLGVSIERLFQALGKEIVKTVDLDTITLPHRKLGPIQLLANIWSAHRRQGDVNHVTGDCHYVVLGLARKRTLLTIHDCVSLRRCKGIKRFFLLWLWYKLPIRWAETITVISSATLEELLGYIPEAKGKVKVIMNCIPSEYQPFPRTLNAQKPIILQIGTNPNKNIERVAEALQGVSCHWRIIGCLTPEQRRSIESHSIEFSNVYDLSDEQMLREYHECDALVFVSTYEGFGMPIVEAQAVGRPVVTSNLSSMPEVAGEAAVLVDPLDISSIRTAILKVISDSEYREQIVQRGFENVKRFRPESIALEYFSIYQKLIS